MGIITGGRIIGGGRVVEGSGTYCPLTIDSAPVDGTSGTFAGVAGVAALLIRTDTGAEFKNTGTQLSPVWTAI